MNKSSCEAASEGGLTPGVSCLQYFDSTVAVSDITIGKTLAHKKATCLSFSQVSMTTSVVSSPSTVSVRSYVSTATTKPKLLEQHNPSLQLLDI